MEIQETSSSETKAIGSRKIRNNAKHEAMRLKDAEPKKGIFRFHEVPGGTLSFSYGPIYKGDETKNFVMTDGQVYTVPFGVAKHLNKNLWYPIHSYTMDEQNKPLMKINEKVRRTSFQSLEFTDSEDLMPEGKPLIEVERMI